MMGAVVLGVTVYLVVAFAVGARRYDDYCYCYFSDRPREARRLLLTPLWPFTAPLGLLRFLARVVRDARREQ